MVAAKPLELYRDPTLPIEERVEDLLGRMTWEEKAAQLGSELRHPWELWPRYDNAQRIAYIQAVPLASLIGEGTGQICVLLRELPPEAAAAKANEIQRYALEHTRLGIPPIIHEEGLHGLIGNGATSFPQAIAMASSWDTELAFEVASAIGRETRARGIRQLLSPTINIARDPRCGRTEETYGEDPYLASRFAVAYVQGVQSQGVVATPKHFAANFVGDGGRDSFPIHFTERLLREVYLPAFEAAVREGGALSIMSAYNSLDGVPCSGNHWLLTDLLRGEWGFEGIVVSDYGAVEFMMTKHHVAADEKHAAKLAVEAGMDSELPQTRCFGAPLVAGIKEGVISEQAVNDSVRRMLALKFRLGVFDEPFVDPAQAGAVCNTKEHKDLALRMAREGIILLKNDGVLPLARSARSIAVLGPLADFITVGGYSWDFYGPDQVITPLRGLTERAKKGVTVNYAPGCAVTGDNKDGFAEAVAVASQSDVAIVFAGNTHKTEGEEKDRASLALPGVQAELIKAVAATGVPTVVVLTNGSAITMHDWIDPVGAVVEAWYCGERGGQAIAEVLFGDYNPGGRLPITFPHTAGQLPLYYNAKPSGRVSDYADLRGGQTLFPFGHGLSYTTFAYRNLRMMPETIGARQSAQISVEIENTGTRAGDEVVQLYVHDVLASVARPLKELKDFRRVTLKPGQTKKVKFRLKARQLGLYNAKMKYVVEPGEFEIMAGSSSQDIRQTGKLTIS